jgi:hypothetical protein
MSANRSAASAALPWLDKSSAIPIPVQFRSLPRSDPDGGNGLFGRSSDGLALIAKNAVDPRAVCCRVAGMSDAVIHRHFGEVEWAHAFEAGDVDAVLSRVGAALVI